MGEEVLKQRWVILVLMGLVIFGNIYAYDSVVPIAHSILKDMGISRAQYGLLYSYYSIPNFIMVLLGGILLDKIGSRKAGTLFAGLCVAGIFMTAAGSTFQLMLFGRLIYGLGAESLTITATKILSRWFRGKELAFAFGLNVTFIRLADFACLNLGARIQNWSGSWRWALWVSLVIMFISFVFFLIYVRFDKKIEKYFVRERQEKVAEKFVFRDILKYQRSFWYIALLCMTFYSAVLPFVAFSNMFLQKKFGLSAARGGFYISLIYIATMVFTPLFGLLVDKVGKRSSIMVFGSFMIVPIYLILGLTTLQPIIPIIALGISFSLVPAALWAAVPILVEEKRLGKAFGLVTLIQNVGLAGFPWVAGKITDLSGGDYKNTMLMFSSLGLMGFILSLALRFSARRGREEFLELPSQTAQANN